MRVIPHTQNMIKKSFEKAKKLGCLNNSLTKGMANAAGSLGEEAVFHYLKSKYKGTIVRPDSPNHDILLNGKKIEVKTKRRRVEPKIFYDVSISYTSKHQQPDLYLFVSLQFDNVTFINNKKIYKNLRYVWLLGQKPPDEYFKQCVFWERGKIDKTNNFKTLNDQYNLKISDLDEVYFPSRLEQSCSPCL